MLTCSSPELREKVRLGKKLTTVVVRVDHRDAKEAEEFLTKYCKEWQKYIELIEEDDDAESGFLPNTEPCRVRYTRRVGRGSAIAATDALNANSMCNKVGDNCLTGCYQGTLAVIMCEDECELFGLTAGHVVLEHWDGKNPKTFKCQYYSDQCILSEVSWADQGKLPDTKTITRIARGFHASFGSSNGIFIDVAKFQIDPDLDRDAIMLNIHGESHPISICIGRLILRRVYKTGIASNTTCGTIVEEDCDWKIKLDGRNQIVHGVFFVEDISGELFSEPGDSGSLVFDSNDIAYGIVIGKKTRHRESNRGPLRTVSVCIRMDNILRHLYQQHLHGPFPNDVRINSVLLSLLLF